MPHRVTFQPSGVRADARGGETVLDAARQCGEPIESACSGKGVCGKCAVKVVSGDVSPQTGEELGVLTPEMLADGYRLSCMAVVRSGCVVEVPETSRRGRQVVLSGDAARPVRIDPRLRRYYIEPGPPPDTAPGSDAARVEAEAGRSHGLDGLSFTHSALMELPGALRASGHKVTLTVLDGREVVSVRPGYSGGLYGVAIDLGTTTLAGYLCDMETGEVIASASGPNPQIPMGEDVMARITYASAKDGAESLRRAAAGGVESLIAGLCSKTAGITPGDISQAALVGNTVMLHLLFGLDTGAMGTFPFTPAVSSALCMTGREAGLVSVPRCVVTTPPVIGGFVGADLVAAASLAGWPDPAGSLLVVDLGTNGEMALFSGGEAVVASCATGPAFEGAHIRHGMRATDGAVERVVIDPDTLDVSLKVIGGRGWTRPGAPTGARGICGSGLVDAVAGMLRAGIIDDKGLIIGQGSHPRLAADDTGEAGFVLAYGNETATGAPVTLTQSDIRALQLAKSAVRAGIEILAGELGVADIDRVLVAGAFGNYIDPASACAIGMFPGIDPRRVEGIGNAALDGARAMLLDGGFADGTLGAEKPPRLVELSMHPDFERRFIAGMDFGA